jgi:hypothetical protein
MTLQEEASRFGTEVSLVAQFGKQQPLAREDMQDTKHFGADVRMHDVKLAIPRAKDAVFATLLVTIEQDP